MGKRDSGKEEWFNNGVRGRRGKRRGLEKMKEEEEEETGLMGETYNMRNEYVRICRDQRRSYERHNR